MTRTEFNGWLEYHCSLYPGINAWLEKQGDSAGILAAWAGVLSHTVERDARAASLELYGQEKQPVYERHPAMIRHIAIEIPHREREQSFARFGRHTVECVDCWDSGTVIVQAFGEWKEKAEKLYGVEKARRLTQAVLCDCTAGRRLVERFEAKKSRPHVLDRDMMTLVCERDDGRPASRDDWQRLKGVVHGVGAAMAAAREPGEEG